MKLLFACIINLLNHSQSSDILFNCIRRRTNVCCLFVSSREILKKLWNRDQTLSHQGTCRLSLTALRKRQALKSKTRKVKKKSTEMPFTGLVMIIVTTTIEKMKQFYVEVKTFFLPSRAIVTWAQVRMIKSRKQIAEYASLKPAKNFTF